MKHGLVALALLLCAGSSRGAVTIASGGKAQAVLIAQPDAVPPEALALRELKEHLEAITGARFEVRNDILGDKPAIIVGQGAVARRYFPEIAWEKLGEEEVIMCTAGNVVLLAGGRPRGTLYAVSRFLQDRLGVRWWTPWATHIPKRGTVVVPQMNVHMRPAFESRDPFWFPAFDGMWAVRNASNSQHARITPEMGGKIVYKGFVHTFFPLVPPETYFAQHPEWYSLINGVRRHEGAQLCTTNPELRRFLVQRVRQWLQETPEARIVSVSQNDWAGPCQCPDCKAIDDREGSHSGTMVELLNYIARELGTEFPNVAFDTLAYQYTRKAPRTVKPLPNVIIRLCSIECNFAAPLTDPSNAAFVRDIQDWSKICQRLYVWDYTTNFAHYVMPHPNYFVLGPNVRFFHEHGVRGLFEQGAYQSFGSEMSELRAWVLAQLLWNPYQDDKRLIREFLEGYYGPKPARYIWQYLQLMSNAAQGFYMTCFTSPNAPYLRYPVLVRAEQLMEQAEQAAAGDPDLVWRVRQARLPLWYSWLVRWQPLRRECILKKGVWPVPTSRKALAERFLAVATGPGPEGWKPMTMIREAGTTPQQFVAQFAEDPPEPRVEPLPKRRKSAQPPAGLSTRGAVEAQDDLARLAEEGTWAEYRGDAEASDAIAVYMPSQHNEWAFQIPVERLPKRVRTGKWQVYALVRVDRSSASASGVAFSAGVWDTGRGRDLGSIAVNASEAATSYRPYLLATTELPATAYIWVAPAPNPALGGVWVDRVWLVPAP